MNLLSILQNQLFEKEKEHYQHSQSILTKHYSEHLKNSLDFKNSDENIDKLLQIQGLFYNEMYEQAWKILIKQKTNNESFNAFIDDLLASSNTRS